MPTLPLSSTTIRSVGVESEMRSAKPAVVPVPRMSSLAMGEVIQGEATHPCGGRQAGKPGAASFKGGRADRACDIDGTRRVRQSDADVAVVEHDHAVGGRGIRDAQRKIGSGAASAYLKARAGNGCAHPEVIRLIIKIRSAERTGIVVL